MTQPQPLIAILDDEPQMCKALSRLLKTHGYDVATFALCDKLLGACASRLPDCLLLDLHMPEMNGFEVLKLFTAQHLNVPVIVITGHDEPGNADRVRAMGGAVYLLKPLKESQLMTAIRNVIKPVEVKQALA